MILLICQIAVKSLDDSKVVLIISLVAIAVANAILGLRLGHVIYWFLEVGWIIFYPGFFIIVICWIALLSINIVLLIITIKQ